MKQFSIELRSFEDVRSFVTIATVKPFPVKVDAANGSISAKNFMGMFALDHTGPLTVSVDCDEDQFQQFLREAACFVKA